MSTALAVRHGSFGRAALYKLNRAFLTHAHRESHLTFWVHGHSARSRLDPRCGNFGRGVRREQTVRYAPNGLSL